jgi:putative endonuclease
MAKEHRYAVYIAANATRLLYVGMSSDLRNRMWKHKNKTFEGFTANWNVCRLVYYEIYEDVRSAINREKQLKGWRRDKKIALIEKMNKNWQDLSEEWFEKPKVNDNGVVLRLRAKERRSAQDDSC